MQATECTGDERSSSEAFRAQRFVSDYVTDDAGFNVFLTTSKTGGKSIRACVINKLQKTEDLQGT